MRKALIEKDRFTLQEIAERWQILFDHPFTEQWILEHCMNDGKLQSESGDPLMLEDFDPLMNPPGTCYMTRKARDRTELITVMMAELGEGDRAIAGLQEPNPRTMNAYLRLIGVLAEWLADLDKLDVEKPFAGAEQISAKAKEYRVNIGGTESVGKKLKEARNLLKASTKPDSK